MAGLPQLSPATRCVAAGAISPHSHVACVGKDREFCMRLAALVRLTLLATLMQVSATAAAERALATIPIGDLVLWFDAVTWRVERDGQTYAVHSVEAGPHDLPIRIEAMRDRVCSPEAMLEAARIWHPGAGMYGSNTITRPGFD